MCCHVLHDNSVAFHLNSSFRLIIRDLNCQRNLDGKRKAMASNLVASLFLIAMPFVPSSFLFLVVSPGAPSSVLAPNSNGLQPRNF